jgi:flagellin-like protein
VSEPWPRDTVPEREGETPTRRQESNQHRGQSAVIGVALLLAITVVSVGVLTAGTSILVEEAAQEADLERIGDTIVSGYQPTTLEGTRTMSLSLTGGTLLTEQREITVSRYGDVIARVQTVALRYERANRAVSIVGGGILQTRAGGTAFVREPNMVSSFGGDGERILILSLVALTGTVEESIDEPRRVPLAFEATHERRDPGAGRYTVRLETAHPSVWMRYFEERGVDVRLVDHPGEAADVVVADLGLVTEARLIIHHVEVQSRG